MCTRIKAIRRALLVTFVLAMLASGAMPYTSYALANEVSAGEVVLEQDAITVVEDQANDIAVTQTQSNASSDAVAEPTSPQPSVVLPEATETRTPSITYRVHGQSYGWQTNKINGEVAGLPGTGKRIEALCISVEGDVVGSVLYSAHLKGKGWTPFAKDGAVCGTTGQKRRVESIKIKLTGKLGRSYDVWYRAFVRHAGWTAWGSNGEPVGSTGLSLQVEAIEVKLSPKGSEPPSNEGSDVQACCLTKPSVRYAAYVQGSGWSKEVKNGTTAGTTDKGLRVEGVRMRLVGSHGSGGIKYRVYKQGTGWTAWSKLNKETELTDNGRRVEAIQVRLTGDIAKVCDVWYRSHVQRYGWMDWTRNGKSSGTRGNKCRLEALQVKIVSKAGKAPGFTWVPFTSVRRHPRLVLIGDSRTVGMYDTLYGGDHFEINARDESGNVWSARIGAGYDWMVSGGVSRVEKQINSNTAVVINLGVNDIVHGTSVRSRYISYINSKAAQWTRKGASVYYAAVSPVGFEPGDDAVTDIYGITSNKGNLSAWNRAMKRRLSPEVTYLDTYHAISSNYRAPDALHYDAATYRRLFAYIRKNAL